MSRSLPMTNHKGISPVIATVLLVAAAILIGAVATVWVSSYTSQQLAKTDTASCAGTVQYTLGEAQFNSSGGFKVKVTNSGTDAVGNFTVEVEHSNGTILRRAAVAPAATANLTAGQSDYIIGNQGVQVDNEVKSVRVLNNVCKQFAASTTQVAYRTPFT